MMRRKISRFKRILSIGCLTIIPISLGYASTFALVKQNNSLIDVDSVKNNKLNDSTTTNNATNNSKLISGLDAINSYSDYDPIYSSATHQVVSNSVGFLGLSKDKKTIILTSYNGLVAWSNKVTEIGLVTSFLSTIGVNDTTNYTVASWLKIDESYLAVLLQSTDTNQPSITFSLNMSNGEIYCPKVDNFGNPIPARNIVELPHEVNAIVTASEQGTYFALPMGEQSRNTAKKVTLVSVNAQGVSGLDLQNLKVTTYNDEQILSITPGAKGSDKNFLLTYSPTTTKFTIYVINGQFKNWYVGLNIAKYSIDNSLFHLNNFTDDQKTELFNSTHRQGFYIGDRSTLPTSNLMNILIPMYGDQTSTSGYIYATYNNSNGNLTTQKITNTSSTGVEQPAAVTVEGTKVFYSSKKTSLNTIFGQMDISNPTSPVFTTIKSSTTEAQKAKPWLFAPVSGTNGAAYVYIDTTSTGGGIKREHLTGTTWSNPIDLSFNKYTDPVSSIKSNSIYTAKIVNSITDAELVSLLNFSNNSLRSTYTISIANRTNNPDNGILEFDYKVETVSWWNSASRTTFYIHVKVEGFYALSNISLAFVNSPSVDNTKYQAINQLKTTKYADQVTKAEILQSFIKYDITTKSNTKLTLTETHITTSVSADKDALTVTVRLPADQFPTGITSFSSIMTRTYTFTGFLSLSGYNFTVNSAASDSLKTKYPSQITFDDIINQVVNLGAAYSKASTDWTCNYTSDDLNGTLTISELKYTKQLHQPVPDDKKNIISSPLVISGLKNTASLFTKRPTIANIPKSSSVGKTPSSIWNEYKTAVDNNDALTLSRNLIYKSLSNPVTLSKDDLVLNITNLATADADGELRFDVTIKQDSKLVDKVGNQNVVFDAAYENKIKQLYPSVYPFKLIQKVEMEKYDVNWNSSTIEKLDNATMDNDNNIVIDLDVNQWNGVTNSMTANEFTDNYENYKDNILGLFSYTDSYIPNISKPLSNLTEGTVVVQVEFTPGISVDKNNKNSLINLKSNESQNTAVGSVYKQVTIQGFKIPSSPMLEFLPFIIIIVLGLSLLILFIFIVIRTKNAKKLNDKKFIRPIVSKSKKYLGSKEIVVESSSILGLGSKEVIKEELINNTKKEPKKWI